jgi:hypothetical protein
VGRRIVVVWWLLELGPKILIGGRLERPAVVGPIFPVLVTSVWVAHGPYFLIYLIKTKIN